MTVWEKLENEECYAVAIYNFTGKKETHLSLEVGELVHVERQTRHWYWGTSLRRDASGAFPKSYVTVRDCVVDRCDETVVASAGGSGVVHDIAVTLREWLPQWKNLYINNDGRLKFMEVSMRALLELRAESASASLPQDQLRRKARTVIFTIDKGNRALGMELAVRNTHGQLIDPTQISAYKLNVLHDEANTKIDKNMESTPVAPAAGGAGGAGAAGAGVAGVAAGAGGAGGARSYSAVVRVHNFVCRVAGRAQLALALHDAAGAKLSEHLLLHWPTQNLHSTLACAVFTDFASDLLKNEKIYLVCNIARIGSMEQQNVDHRRSSIAMSTPIQTTSASAMRRPFGIACADIKRSLIADSPDKHIQLPFYPLEKENLDSLLKKVIVNKDIKDAKHSQGLWVSLQLVEGGLKQIREENPHLVVGNVCEARKMGFPEVILPGDARNELYVTVAHGSFSKGGGKSSERNIELTARVADAKGRTMPGVISIGAGVPLVDEYTSIVYYHDDRPRWQETFKVCLDIDEFKEAHLVFLCRHRSSNEAKDRSEKHFALSYLRLMQKDGTTTPDTFHNLCVYKIDHKKSASSTAEVEAAAAAACLELPMRRDALPAGAERGMARGVLALVQRDSLTVATKLCSTKLTQREEILGVLKWNTYQLAEGSLRTALARLLQVPSEELVKFLQDILDALFNILTKAFPIDSHKNQNLEVFLTETETSEAKWNLRLCFSLRRRRAELLKEVEGDGYSEQSYGVLVLECLLRVISLVADHKYQHFQPVLHVYIDDSFCDALAYENLISVIVWTIRAAKTTDDVALKRVLVCMKCIESLVRLIVRSRELRRELQHRASDHDFKRLFDSLLESLVWLMRCGDHALTCQGSALKFFPHAVPHIIKVYPETDLCAYVVRALEALPIGRLSKQRMLALLELVRGPLCATPAARSLLLPHLANTLHALLADKAEWDRSAAHKSRSKGKAARLLGADTTHMLTDTRQQQIVELCVETLGEVMSLLARDDVGPVEADIGELSIRLLPTVLRTAGSMLAEENETNEALVRRMVSVLLDMVRQMSEEQYKLVVRALENECGDGSGTLVGNAISLLLKLLEKPVFKPHWADMLTMQFHVMLHALKLLSITLRERISIDDADLLTSVQEQCRLWFDACAGVATKPPLQLETLHAARKQRVLAHYGDIRRGLAECMKEMWFSLGEHKRAFIPCLVGPFLEVSFLRDEEVRNTTIPIFFDMMQTEYTHSVAHGENGESYLKELESELIDKLDTLVERGCGDAAWRVRFVSLCGALCGAAPGPLRLAAAALVAAAARQLDTLLLYRTAAQKSPTPHRMHLTTKVLHFYEQIERPHMYIRYVHKLAKMYQASQQWVEAGLTLQLHAKLLLWSHDPLPPRLQHPTMQHDNHTTHRELKEYLYLEIADLLTRGRQWEAAVVNVKQLVQVYEDSALGYAPLAELHAQLAQLYLAITRTPRSHPGYFRVIYHGKGFPELLRVPKGFVYRGNEYEQLQGFMERLLDEWPDAEVLLKLDPPGEEITDSDGQYLQINAVEPVMSDKLKRLSGKPIAEQILQYYKHNNVDKFMFSRPFHRPEESLNGSIDDVSNQNEFATRWLERTELEISDKLPGILRWFPVVSQRTFWVAPVEAAVESLRNTNRTLKSLVLEARSQDAPLQPLTMRLNGMLDPAVQGGIVNYERSFLTPAYEARHPEHKQLLTELKDLIADQIPLLKYGLDVHGSRAPGELEELHAHMLACFRRARQHVHQRYGRKTCDLEVEPEVQLRMTLRDSTYTDQSNTSSNRISDISTGTESSVKSPVRFFPRNSSGSSYLSNYLTLQGSPRRKKKQGGGRKSEIVVTSSGSQWYTSPGAGGAGAGGAGAGGAGAGGAAASRDTLTPGCAPPAPPAPAAPPALDAGSPLRELRQELVTERPLRAEAEREKRLSSQRASVISTSAPPSNRDSLGTTDSNQEEEEPPPLPKKFNHRSMELDEANNNGESNPLPHRYNYDTVFAPRGSFLYNSMAHRTKEKAPTPPPKKRNAQ